MIKLISKLTSKSQRGTPADTLLRRAIRHDAAVGTIISRCRRADEETVVVEIAEPSLRKYGDAVLRPGDRDGRRGRDVAIKPRWRALWYDDIAGRREKRCKVKENEVYEPHKYTCV